MGIRPSDLSLALRTIASYDSAAFELAVRDEAVRRYLHECRGGATSQTGTLAWSRGFARFPDEFRQACSVRADGELDLDLPLAILAGVGERGALLAEHGASKLADTESFVARLGALEMPMVELDGFIEFSLASDPQRLMLAMVSPDPVRKLSELSGVDWSTLAPHFIWQRLAAEPVPTEEILRYHSVGMTDPLNLERAYLDELPEEYGRALDT